MIELNDGWRSACVVFVGTASAIWWSIGIAWLWEKHKKRKREKART